MEISHERRFAFFAMPKTGSNSMRTLLHPYSEVPTVHFNKTTAEQPFYDHMRPVEARALFVERGWPFEQYYRFAVTRNPWARLVSLYEHLLLSRRFRWERRLGRTPRDFERWVASTQPDGPGAGTKGNRYRMYGSYSVGAFVGDGNGHELVDEVIRLEDLAGELPRLGERLGIELAAALPKKNTRAHADYREYYTTTGRNLVAERYRADIERFGYEF